MVLKAIIELVAAVVTIVDKAIASWRWLLHRMKASQELPSSLEFQDNRLNIPVEQLDLSVRTVNCLRHAGITTVGEVLARDEKELLLLRNFGTKSLTEIRERIEATGLSWPDSTGVQQDMPTAPYSHYNPPRIFTKVVSLVPKDYGEFDQAGYFLKDGLLERVGDKRAQRYFVIRETATVAFFVGKKQLFRFLRIHSRSISPPPSG